MLWATRETHREVELYATDQAKFFANYAIAHVRMAPVSYTHLTLPTTPYV